MSEFSEVLAPIIEAAGADARRDWETFKNWTDKTVSGPGDLKAAARADRFASNAAMIGAIAEAFSRWTPSSDPRDLKAIQYAMYLAIRSGRAEAAMLQYIERVMAQRALDDDDKRREAFTLRRFAGWIDPTGASLLSRGLRRIFDSELFQIDQTLRWARGLDFAVRDDERWNVTAALETRPGSRHVGTLNAAALILTAPYPSYRAGSQGWSALLWADFNHPKPERDFRDIEFHWPRGERPQSRRGGAAVEERFSLERLPALPRLEEFPAFVASVEALVGARFMRSKATVRGLPPMDRARLKKWLAGKDVRGRSATSPREEASSASLIAAAPANRS